MDIASSLMERELFARGPMVLLQWAHEDGWPVEYVSANVEKVLGYQAGALVGRSFMELIDPLDIAQVKAEIEAHSAEWKEEFKHEPFRIVGPGDEPIWLLAHTAIFRDELGQISHYLSYVLDASGRLKAEQALKQSEARYHQMFETNLAVKLIIDPSSGRIVEANQAAARFYGYDLDALTQMKITDINTLSEQAAALELERARSEERLFFNFKHRLQSGEVRDVEVYSGPVETAEGTLLYSIIYDVTERHRAEKSLQASHQELAETLAKLEQTQAQMIQRERLAAVGQLTAGIAHDFNNILSGILGFAELLHRSPSTPQESKDDLENIIQSGERGVQLIRQLLDFSRASTQEYQPLNLGVFLKEFAVFLVRTIPSNIKVAHEIDDGDLWVRADPTQLHQVLTNLAFNARDAMPQGGTLTLSLSRVSLEEGFACVICDQTPCGDWIRLEVCDTGSGIAAEVLPRIFEPFFTTKPTGQGSGLGLSQVAGIIGQHQGHIQVKSVPGEGSCFRCFFPSNGHEAQDTERSDDQILLGAGETILLVEDDSIVHAVLRTMLKNLHYNVLDATSGERALALFEQHPDIALTLSDVMMPGLSGMELFRRLKQKDPDHRVILMSGYPLDDEETDELQQEGADWVQKPISLLQLSRLLHTTIHRDA